MFRDRMMKTGFLAASLVLLAGLTAPGLARAEMMTSCQPEIAQYCGGVSKGRGRIAACLVGRTDQLSAACRPEVQATMKSPFIPGDMRSIFQPGFDAPIPASCAPAARRYCSGITSQGRVFACLYAHSSQAGGACAADARAGVAAGGS
jgi:hypothetical protein